MEFINLPYTLGQELSKQNCPGCNDHLHHYIGIIDLNGNSRHFDLYKCSEDFMYYKLSSDKREDKENCSLIQMTDEELEDIVFQNAKFFDLNGKEIDLNLDEIIDEF